MALVLEPENELLLHFADHNGARATSEYFIANDETDPSSGAAAAIADAAQAISNDFLFSIEILRHATETSPGAATDGPYARPADKAALSFVGADGSLTKMEIPAPNETIFDASTVKTDPADTAFAAFVTYVLANCVSSEGAALVALQRGVRIRPPRLKKQ